MVKLNSIKSIEEQAESILIKQGISIEQALSMFFNQVVSKNGLPFDIEPPLDMSKLTNEQLAHEIEKTEDDVYYLWEDVKDELIREYGLWII